MTDNFEQFDGMALSDVLAIADEKYGAALRMLTEAHNIYQSCANQKFDKHSLAPIKSQVWTTQKKIGGKFSEIYFSQSGQDRFIYESFFEGRDDGFYLEIGGYNGWAGSNCLFFELRGWDGLVVEASPTRFKEMKQIRRATLVNSAISDVNGTAEFVDVTKGYTQMSGLIDSLELLETVRENPAHKENLVKVPTLTIDELCRMHNITEINYCSIDIEGAEFAALNGIDFDRVKIDVISIENATRQRETPARTFLESKGYELVEVVGVDEIFRKSE